MPFRTAHNVADFEAVEIWDDLPCPHCRKRLLQPHDLLIIATDGTAALRCGGCHHDTLRYRPAPIPAPADNGDKDEE